jgi:serine/threonine protein kinase
MGRWSSKDHGNNQNDDEDIFEFYYRPTSSSSLSTTTSSSYHRKRLRLFLWLSLVGAFLHSKSTLFGDAVVLADEDHQHQQHHHHQQHHGQQPQKHQHDNGDLIIMEDGSSSTTSINGAVEVLHYHHNSENNDDDGDDDFDPDSINSDSSSISSGVIVVVAVDGTLAGISKKNGEVLWMRQPNDIINGGSGNSKPSSSSPTTTPLSSYSSSSSPSSSRTTTTKSKNPTLDEDADSFLMQPLVSTTTTTKSASSSNYAAVPSVDGTVFTTSNDMTVSSSVKDLVGRAPFLDPKGRFYVGSRHATAAALDGDTGEVLRVISTPDHKNNNRGDKSSNNNHDDNETLPDLEGRNVVWIGRVDYQVSVQDARTGMMEAQFSVAEVMSVADMNGMTEKEAWKPERLQSSSSAASSSSSSSGKQQNNWSGSGATNQAEQEIVHRLGLPASHDPFEVLSADVVRTDDTNEAAVIPSTLVATPNGNVGFWNYETDGLSWIADETFNTPIAFAMDADTGLPVDVDLIPDVTDPTADRDSIAREIERQLEMSARDSDQPDEQTIVGAMKNGQLFALPLGRKAASRALLSGRSAPGSFTHKGTVARASNQKTSGHTGTHLPGRSTTNVLPSESHHHQLDEGPNGLLHHSTESHPLSAKKACVSSSPTFPGCLVRDRANNYQHNHHSSGGQYNFIPKRSRSNLKPTSEVPPPSGRGSDRYHYLPIGSGPHGNNGQSSMAVMTSHFHREEGGFYHPEFGYVSPQDLHRAQQRNSQRKFNRRLLWVLGSWLGPALTIAFVVAFELGRRKRLRDEKVNGQDSLQESTVPTVDSKADDRPKSASKSILDLSLVQESTGLQQQHVIKVSDEVLGYGGHGTVVYKGVLDGREVAVKRMLKAYHASADREISLLIESDGDPNVVRYFLKEVRGDFVYLALELCDLSLHDLIGVLREERQSIPQQTPSDSRVVESTQRILLQIASGVKHLHSQCRIVHRDLKPANILLAISKRAKKKGKKDDPIFDSFLHDYYDAKISDMGLGKFLKNGQSSLGASLVGESSFRGSTGGRATSIGVGPGSVGWQAPEVMALRPRSDMSTRSNDSANNDVDALADASTNPRTSRSVDIFSLGCIFYSVLIPGSHPFGEWFEREANIMHNKLNLSPLKSISTEAFYLINAMLDRDPRLRPSAKGVCEHPFFWNSHKRLIFLCDVSDRLETECTSQATANANSLAIERGAMDIVGTSWESRLDLALVDNVNKFRTYDYACIRDLLRLIRNKHHHFDELPSDFRESTVPDQNALLEYFQGKFPGLVMHCYNFCRQNLEDDDALVSKYGIIPLPKVEQKVVPTPPVAMLVEEKRDIVVQDTDACDIHKSTDDEIPSNRTSAIVSDNNITGDTSPLSSDVPPSLAEELDAKDDVVVDPVKEAADAANDTVRTPPLVSAVGEDDIIVWEGSTAAKAFNCRGWGRSQDEWSRRIEPCYKKRDLALKRCAEDPKFRTRLCNHWDVSHGTDCPMRKKGKCVFAHGPAELRVKEGKKKRWGRLVDKNGNNSNPWHSGGEDTFGAATSIENVRKEEGKWNTNSKSAKFKNGISSSTPTPKKKRNNTKVTTETNIEKVGGPETPETDSGQTTGNSSHAIQMKEHSEPGSNGAQEQSIDGEDQVKPEHRDMAVAEDPANER